jgi:hypothetical protein
MSVVLVSNSLLLEEHITRIVSARDNLKEGLYHFIYSIRDAYQQLPHNSFQNILCEKLDMKKSQLSKWVSISASNFINENLHKLPPSFSSLYTITLIEKKYSKKYPVNYFDRLNALVKNKEITNKTDRGELEFILKRVTQLIRIDEQNKRHNSLLSLTGGKLAENISTKTIDEYIKDKTKFNSFVVIPTDEQISRWSNVGLFPSDIAEEFPLQDLRSVSVKETLTCVIKVRMKKIDTGIKLLNSWGFSYRDVLVPPLTNSYCSILDEEFVIVRGERGVGKKLSKPSCFSFNTEDLLDFVEQNYSTPSLLVFDKTIRNDWSCLS